MPDDMADAFDGLKLAIMRAKFDGWREISRGDTVEALGYLVAMAMEHNKENDDG